MEYAISVDITMSKTLYIEAKNENEAHELATEHIRNNAYELARTADAYVTHEIIGIEPS